MIHHNVCYDRGKLFLIQFMLQCDEISLNFTAGSVCLCGVCSHVFVLVTYVDAMVAVIVMHVMLFVLHVCMLRECEGDGNAASGDGGDVVVVSAGHVGGTHDLGIVYSAADVLRMTRVGEMCMCLAQGGI